MDKKAYCTNFLEQYKQFKKKQNKQRLRGLNDYNVFSALYPDCSNEVHLHSGFIYSLLNPDGEHYQGPLFLDLFIKAIGLESFGLDIESAYVKKEHHNIDIYISDGNKHIILENKIFAQDQEKQITRYIKKIESEIIKEKGNNPNDNPSDSIYVLYLSLDRDMPNSNSIAGYEYHGEYLVSKTNQKEKVRFKAIKYKKDIQKWLELSLKEVENLTNLHFAITQYQEAIKKLCGLYKKRGIAIIEFFGHDIDKWRFITSEIINISDIEPFLHNEGDRDIIQEILSERDKLILDNIDTVAEELFDHIKKSSQPAKNAINDIKVLRKYGEYMYADGIYINLYLKNKLIIQLEYSHEMLPRNINLQFWKVTRDKEATTHPFRTSTQAYRSSLAELICNNATRRQWLEYHGDEFIAQLSELIETPI